MYLVLAKVGLLDLMCFIRHCRSLVLVRLRLERCLICNEGRFSKVVSSLLQIVVSEFALLEVEVE